LEETDLTLLECRKNAKSCIVISYIHKTYVTQITQRLRSGQERLDSIKTGAVSRTLSARHVDRARFDHAAPKMPVWPVVDIRYHDVPAGYRTVTDSAVRLASHSKPVALMQRVCCSIPYPLAGQHAETGLTAGSSRALPQATEAGGAGEGVSLPATGCCFSALEFRDGFLEGRGRLEAGRF
jgi:hypothetical protein